MNENLNRIFNTTVLVLFISLFSCANSDHKYITELIGKMTLEEKIGQMTQVDYRYLKDKSDITKYFLGSILSGGGSTPPTNQPSLGLIFIMAFKRSAKTRLRIPLIYGIDASFMDIIMFELQCFLII